ncbi:MAG: hypothetical protein M3Q23_13525 [Actinomycetota bacterium]|nr:hypothetical protein [Actinomycetota bacterium]
MATVAVPAARTERSPLSWLARAAWLAAIAMVAFSGVQILEAGHVSRQFIQQGIGGSDLLALIFASVGAVIAARQPRNRVGWIILAVGLLYAAGTVSEGYFDHLTRTGSWLPGAWTVMWIGSWNWMPALGLLATFVLLLFPDGHLPSRRWWPLAIASAAVIIATTALHALESWLIQGDLFAGREPTPTPLLLHLQFAVFLGEVLGGCCLVGSVVAVVARYRRASADLRQQLKWGTYGSIGLAAALAAVWIPGNWFQWGAAISGSLWFAACVAVAILRYRLLDIDLIVNRTLVYGGLTALLGGIYVGAVFGLGALVRSIGGHGNNGLVVAASTLAVAALFSPARRGLQAFIDRRFYRRKYDAARTLESFGARLRDDVDLDELSGHLVGVVQETMQPAQVSLWLRASGDGVAARSGAEPTRS